MLRGRNRGYKSDAAPRYNKETTMEIVCLSCGNVFRTSRAEWRLTGGDDPDRNTCPACHREKKAAAKKTAAAKTPTNNEREADMSGVNKAILIGNLGSDPELRYTQNGTPVVNFTMATNEQWTGKDGQKQERTEWHRIVVWDKQADACAKYLAKGRQVYVEGRIQTREWEDREGQKRYTTEIVAQSVTFLGAPAGGQTGAPAGGQTQEDVDPDPFNGEDIPF